MFSFSFIQHIYLIREDVITNMMMLKRASMAPFSQKGIAWSYLKSKFEDAHSIVGIEKPLQSTFRIKRTRSPRDIKFLKKRPFSRFLKTTHVVFHLFLIHFTIKSDARGLIRKRKPRWTRCGTRHSSLTIFRDRKFRKSKEEKLSFKFFDKKYIR